MNCVAVELALVIYICSMAGLHLQKTKQKRKYFEQTAIFSAYW